MARMHIHISVADLAQNIRFYTTLFGTPPSVNKPDYAKWELADPAVNFAISCRGGQAGLDHVGIQAEDAAALAAIRDRLQRAGIEGAAQEGTTCCYARSDKYWTQDPQGIAWEAFHTLEAVPTFSSAPAAGACCAPRTGPSCC
ncbi:MAG: ArsI/CadI family heavy metal resistance metalloenzyme [Pseudomonadota bacterium]